MKTQRPGERVMARHRVLFGAFLTQPDRRQRRSAPALYE
jgi:hypothetical protein